MPSGQQVISTDVSSPGSRAPCSSGWCHRESCILVSLLEFPYCLVPVPLSGHHLGSISAISKYGAENRKRTRFESSRAKVKAQFHYLLGMWLRQVSSFSDPVSFIYEIRIRLPFLLGFPCASAGKESACNAGDGLVPWVGKIPWRRERLPTPVFWPGEFHGLCSSWGRKESDTTERLSLYLFCWVIVRSRNYICQKIGIQLVLS